MVLEGGGMRGVYTAGVLDFFLEKGLIFPYVIGVSAGACHACSYISQQQGRNKVVTIDYVEDPRYLGYRNLWRERSILGMSFIFDEIPNRLEPFDFDAFRRSPQQFVICTTDAEEGTAQYFEKSEVDDILKIVRASSSLPFVTPPVKWDGKTLFDGGIADSIPVAKARKDGFLRNVVVLTRDSAYRKKPFKQRWLAKAAYSKYPKLVDALTNRSIVYNETLDDIERLEQAGEVFVIRPSVPLTVGRLERKSSSLLPIYELGYKNASEQFDRLEKWVTGKAEMQPTV